jgi:hypothetical protein
MTADLIEQATAPTFPAKEMLPVHVFIAYDDQAAYRRALRVLVNVNQQLDDDLIEFHPLPWRFKDLADQGLRRLAAEDISRAQILVLTTSAEGALPEAIQEWLPQCLAQRRDCGAAIVSLLGSPDQTTALKERGSEFIRKTAETVGWHFIEAAQEIIAKSSPRQSFQIHPS